MKPFLKAAFFVAVLIVANSYKNPQSTGAPASHTGAPDEQTCSKSSCHDDNTINDGASELIILFDNGLTSSYVPGKKYSVTVSISNNLFNRFGFEVVCLKNNDDKNTGIITITDSSRTQVIKNYNEFTDRNYITYTYYGTTPFSSGIGKWSFDWTAPADDEGPVTFYVAAVTANDDGTDNGDYVYTNSVTISPLKATGINTNVVPEVFHQILIYTVDKSLNISYCISENSFVEISLIDLLGRQVETLYSEQQLHGKHNHLFNLSENYAAGIYFVRLKNNNKISVKKIYIH